MIPPGPTMPAPPAQQDAAAAVAAVATSRARLLALALGAGQALEAKVLGPAPAGLTRIAIAGQTLTVSLPLPPPVGTVMQAQLRVQPDGRQPLLVLSYPGAAPRPAPAALPAAVLPASVAAPAPAALPLVARPAPPPPASSRIPALVTIALPPVASSNSGLPPPPAAASVPPSPAVPATAPAPAPATPPPPSAPALASHPAQPALASPFTPQAPPSPGTAGGPPAAPPTVPSLPAAAATPTGPAPAGTVPVAGTGTFATPVAAASAPPVASTSAPSAVPTTLPALGPATLASLPAAGPPPSPPPPLLSPAGVPLRPVLSPPPDAPAASPERTSAAGVALGQTSQAAARQDSIAPLLQNLATLQNRMAHFPRPVAEAALRLLAGRLLLSAGAPAAAQLKQAVLRSGVLVHNSPVGAASLPDLRTGLLQLRSALLGFLGSEIAPVAPVARRPPPPTRDGQLRGHRAEPPTLPEAATPRDAGRTLLHQTDAALSRIRLLQLASLPPDAGRAGAPPAAADLTLEIPMLLGGELAVAQMRIAADGRSTGSKRPRGWRLQFSVNFSVLGEVGAQIGFSERRTGIALWAEEPATAAALESMLPELDAALAGRGLEVASLRVGRRAPQPSRPRAGQLLDGMR